MQDRNSSYQSAILGCPGRLFSLQALHVPQRLGPSTFPRFFHHQDFCLALGVHHLIYPSLDSKVSARISSNCCDTTSYGSKLGALRPITSSGEVWSPRGVHRVPCCHYILTRPIWCGNPNQPWAVYVHVAPRPIECWRVWLGICRRWILPVSGRRGCDMAYVVS